MGSLGGGELNAFCAPNLEDHVEKTSLTPSPNSITPYAADGEVNPLKGLSPEQIIGDPKRRVAFVQKNPERLDPKSIEPAVIMTISQLLMESGAWLSAERLLDGAVRLHKDRSDLQRAHARVLIQLGRPNSALRSLEKTIELNADKAEFHFLLGLAVLRVEPALKNRQARAVEAFQRVLELSPNYRDPSGWGAQDLRTQLQRLGSSVGGATR